MGDRASPGLIMDFVATRAIEPGEELFLDYGDAWETTWQQHQRDFESRRHEYADYMSARDWNDAHGNAILRTKAEQATAPYPANMQLHCLDEDEEVVLDSEKAKSEWTIDTSGEPCQIASRRVDDEGDVFYKVWYESQEEDETGTLVTQREWHESEWLVREAIQ